MMREKGVAVWSVDKRSKEIMLTARRIPILCYHGLFADETDRRRLPAGVLRYFVSVKTFASHLNALAAQGYRPVPLTALLADGPPITVQKPIVVTFDDGWVSDADLARPILDGLGWRSEHFIIVDWVGAPHFMDWQQIRALSRSGHGVHSHTMTHSHLDRLSLAERRCELELSKIRLEARLERTVDFLALPGGHGMSTPLGRLAHACGYRGICTSMVGLNRRSDYWLRRILLTDRATARDVVELASGSGLTRMRLQQATLRIARRALGARRYDVLREALLTQAAALMSASPLPRGRA
jgi:peptidoglycan/xylan/chitin deacetylase (PgdA/CDA1 family)